MITGKRADRIIIDDPGYDPEAAPEWLTLNAARIEGVKPIIILSRLDAEATIAAPAPTPVRVQSDGLRSPKTLKTRYGPVAHSPRPVFTETAPASPATPASG